MLKHTKHLFITTFHNVREIHSTNIVKKQSQFQEYHNTQVWDVQPTDFRRQMFPKLGKVHSTNPFEKRFSRMRLPKTSMHQASRSGISNPQTLMNKQPNNKTWFVYVFPSDIKPRFLTNLPHLRVRFHGYVIIWEMAAETNTQITTTNKQIRNAGEVHSTTIGKK